MENLVFFAVVSDLHPWQHLRSLDTISWQLSTISSSQTLTRANTSPEVSAAR
jgi:hypothetical protein